VDLPASTLIQQNLPARDTRMPADTHHAKFPSNFLCAVVQLITSRSQQCVNQLCQFSDRDRFLRAVMHTSPQNLDYNRTYVALLFRTSIVILAPQQLNCFAGQLRILRETRS